MPTHTIDHEDIRQLIRYELGQAPASLYVEARSKSPEARLRAIDRLTARIAVRFEGMTVSHELPERWKECPFTEVQVAPRRG